MSYKIDEKNFLEQCIISNTNGLLASDWLVPSDPNYKQISSFALNMALEQLKQRNELFACEKNNNSTQGIIKAKVDIEQRKAEFATTFSPFFEKYSKDMLLDFFLYWAEPTKNGLKFRQELQKTWDLSRRLETWSKNNFNNKENGKREQGTLFGRQTRDTFISNCNGW